MDDGAARLREGARFEIDMSEGVYLGGDTLRVHVHDHDLAPEVANVTIVEMTNKPKGLHFNCDKCPELCDHIGAVVNMVLNEKLTLGLSAPPDPSEPLELLTEEELLQRAPGRPAPTRRDGADEAEVHGA